MNDSPEVDPWKRHISINQFSKKVSVNDSKRVNSFQCFPPQI